MRKSILFLLMAIVLALAGCSQQSTPVDSQPTSQHPIPDSTTGDFLQGEAARAFLRENAATTLQTPIRDVTQSATSYPDFCFAFNIGWMPQVPPGDWGNTKNCGQTCCVYLGQYFNNGTLAPWVISSENRWLAGYTGDTRYLSANGWKTGSSTLPPLLKAFHALRCNVYYGNQPDDVVMEGARGNPVIVAVKTRMGVTTGIPHYMLFVGYDGIYMYFHDPGRSSAADGKYVRYTVQQFCNSWATQGKQYIPVFR